MADDGLGDVPMETESVSFRICRIEVEFILQMPQYTISHVIEAHKSDTKALAVTQGGCLISGGRDETVKFWAKKGKQYTKTHAFEQPKGITVNSIAYAELADGWRLFVGRRDGTIAVFGPSQAEPYAIFNEHKQNGIFALKNIQKCKMNNFSLLSSH